MHSSLRIPLPILCAFLALGLGLLYRGEVWADGFDEYVNCPRPVRLDQLGGLRVSRTEEADKFRVSWIRPDLGAIRSLGANRFRAEVTVIASGERTAEQTATARLGATGITFQNMGLAEDFDIEAALTVDDHIISHIAAVEFTSGLGAPVFGSKVFYEEGPIAFSDPVRHDTEGVLVRNAHEVLVVRDSSRMTAGHFYYLGYGRDFSNQRGATVNSRIFRVGLAHRTPLNPSDANFGDFRLRVLDAEGDDVLGYDPRTFSDSTYDRQVLALGAQPAELWADDRAFSTVREAQKVRGGPRPIPALYDDAVAVGVPVDRTSWWSLAADTAVAGQLFAPGPDGYAPLPGHFVREGRYTLLAWAEDEDYNRISPHERLVLHLMERPGGQHILDLTALEDAGWAGPVRKLSSYADGTPGGGGSSVGSTPDDSSKPPSVSSGTKLSPATNLRVRFMTSKDVVIIQWTAPDSLEGAASTTVYMCESATTCHTAINIAVISNPAHTQVNAAVSAQRTTIHVRVVIHALPGSGYSDSDPTDIATANR